MAPDLGTTGQPSWKELFLGHGPVSGGTSLSVSVFKKAGEPLLVVPAGNIPPGAALSLYAAQSPRAKLAKAAWRFLLSCRLPLGAARDSIEIDPQHAFVHFLRSLAPGREVPLFSLLAGNPRAPGRRFLLLLFDRAGHPVAVVKAGVGAPAQELIRKEATFLEKVPPGTTGIPKLRATLFEEKISAFAMDYVSGRAPLPRESAGIIPILQNWVLAKHRVRLGETIAWRRLETASKADTSFSRIASALRDCPVNPVIFHGDLAPWNIKISDPDQSWTVLDWERGELFGIPGWDWFHYVIQPALLVRKERGPALVATREALLHSEPFAQYASLTGISGHERELFLAYSLHCRDVLRPAEGSPGVEELCLLS